MPWPLRSRNLAIVDSGSSGASSWMHEPGVADASIASRTPCSSLTSSWSDLHAVGVAVERDRLVEVGHGDADVVDGGEQVPDVAKLGGHGVMLYDSRARGRGGVTVATPETGGPPVLSQRRGPVVAADHGRRVDVTDEAERAGARAAVVADVEVVAGRHAR